ncbi:MAG: DUF1684 domain-containing protein [Bacteroidota bacterium]
MRKKIITALLIILPVAVYFGIRSSQEGSGEDYINEILKERTEKEDYMQTSSASPFIKNLSNYEPLKYYDVDPAFKVKASVEKITDIAYVSVSESKGSTKQYLKYAWLHFKLDDQPLKLLVLKPVGFGQMNVLFTAFADDTSGNETYGSGRYLDLNFKNASSITLDFNKAYNPYCAYDESFSCPFPPRENVLPVRITAGEKVYHP